MNISKYRNSYLIDKTYRLTLVSALSELSDGFQMTIKDCGRPYDPVHNGMDAASVGARSATYRYMFTMNVTTIVWSKQ